MMQVVLITGRIGSGKSTVAEYLKQKKYQVIKIDDFLEILEHDYEYKFNVLKYFGPESIGTNDSINSNFIRNNIFKPENKEYLECLERIAFKKFIEYTIYFNGLTFIEVPEKQEILEKFKGIFFEYSYKIIIKADAEKRYKRVNKRSNLDYQLFYERDNIQFDSTIEKNDILIENNGSIKELYKSVENIIKTKIKLRHELL